MTVSCEPEVNVLELSRNCYKDVAFSPLQWEPSLSLRLRSFYKASFCSWNELQGVKVLRNKRGKL